MEFVGEKCCYNNYVDCAIEMKNITTYFTLLKSMISKTPKTISVDNENFYIDNRQFDIYLIKAIYYGLSDDKQNVYVQIIPSSKDFKLKEQEVYRVENPKQFAKILNKKGIMLLPTLLDDKIYMAKGYAFSVNFYCQLYGKYMFSLINSNSHYFCVHIFSEGMFSVPVKDLYSINLNKCLLNPTRYNPHNKQTVYYSLFKIIILDKTLTIDRGFGVYPVKDKQIIIDDIFYSFDEKEIKAKIIELFKKHDAR